MREEWGALCKLIRPQGVKGKVRGMLLTDVLENFQRPWIYWIRDEEKRQLYIDDVRFQSGAVIFKFRGVDDRDAARDLVGGTLEIPLQELVPLGPDEYYHFQLTGMDVYTEDGEHLGVLEEIMETGGHDVYVVRMKEQEVLLPAVKQVILEVSLDRKRMIVRLMEGLR